MPQQQTTPLNQSNEPLKIPKPIETGNTTAESIAVFAEKFPLLEAKLKTEANAIQEKICPDGKNVPPKTRISINERLQKASLESAKIYKEEMCL